jgi:hypothetical protein
MDNQGGIERKEAPGWLGYRTDSIIVNISLKEKKPVSQVVIGLLRKEDSWIFLPGKIVVTYFDTGSISYLPFASEFIFSSEPLEGSRYFFARLFPDREVFTDKINIVLYPVTSIPPWHEGKGQHAWCFMDEIKLY